MFALCSLLLLGSISHIFLPLVRFEIFVTLVNRSLLTSLCSLSISHSVFSLFVSLFVTLASRVLFSLYIVQLIVTLGNACIQLALCSV